MPNWDNFCMRQLSAMQTSIESVSNNHQPSALVRIVLMLCAIIIAIIITELIVSKAIGYPHYTDGTRKFQIHTRLGAYNILNWRPPYYKFWSVEGGNKVYTYNNIGLPGSDIDKTRSRNIYVLGSSFIEAMSVSREETATAVFQNMLDSDSVKYNVINLGCSGHDPYVMWFRSQFFARYFTPDYVIVVLDPSSIGNLRRRWEDTLSFEIPPNLPVELPLSPVRKYTALPRKYSAFINLVLHGFKSQVERLQINDLNADFPHDELSAAFNKMEQCIAMYAKQYNNVLFVSIINSTTTNHILEELCTKYHVYFAADNSILQSGNRIDRYGHLSVRGNQLLGSYLYDVFNDNKKQ